MDIEQIEGRIDKVQSASIAISESLGGVRLENMVQVMELAKMLSVSKQAVPPHLRTEPGICLAICIQALEWRMSPYAVANKSYVVNDRLAYESQLIHAVIESRAPLQGRLRCTYDGEGLDRSCTVTGLLKGEKEPHVYTSPTIRNIKVKNSPLWTGDPDQQLFYYSSRSWSRKWVPDVLLGIFSDDELRDSEPMRDITPARPDLKKRLTRQAGSPGFDGGNVDKAVGAVVTDKPTGDPGPTRVVDIPDPPTATETGAETRQAGIQTQGPEAPLGEAAQGGPVIIDTPETPLARGKRLLALVATKEDVTDLQATISDELPEEQQEGWKVMCEARTTEIEETPTPKKGRKK